MSSTNSVFIHEKALPSWSVDFLHGTIPYRNLRCSFFSLWSGSGIEFRGWQCTISVVPCQKCMLTANEWNWNVIRDSVCRQRLVKEAYQSGQMDWINNTNHDQRWNTNYHFRALVAQLSKALWFQVSLPTVSVQISRKVVWLVEGVVLQNWK